MSKKIMINGDGYVGSSFIKDATNVIEIDDKIYSIIKTCEYGYVWKYDFNNKQFEKILLNDNKILRNLREIECFSILDNRSKLWYDNLSEEQLSELKEWYKAWLNVTETKVIPEKPSWLN